MQRLRFVSFADDYGQLFEQHHGSQNGAITSSTSVYPTDVPPTEEASVIPTPPEQPVVKLSHDAKPIGCG